jgi:acetylornithine aminotransferase
MPTYGRLPVSFNRGEGAWLWDNNGTRFLDALSGIAVCNLGHAHPAVHAAICKQSEKLLHTSNLYGLDLQEQLADKLCQLSNMESVFFCNSGAEANEAAIKIARRYGNHQGIDKPAIITMEKSFHGRTMATLSATGNPKIQQGFTPLLDGFVHVPFNDIPAIEQMIQSHSNIVAILAEPVQGEGGVNIPDADYLNKIRDICDHHQILMMLDEIQTGIGRTGKFLAHQHNNITPDVCTLAKALGNGVPIGACLASGKAAEQLTAGTHGSTFGGNLLACSAALAVLDTLTQEGLIEEAEKKGELISSEIAQKLQNNKQVSEIRHKGLMIGIELLKPCLNLAKEALAKNLLINVTNEKTIRLLPPLIIDQEQIDYLVNTLAELITEHTDQQ